MKVLKNVSKFKNNTLKLNVKIMFSEQEDETSILNHEKSKVQQLVSLLEELRTREYYSLSEDSSGCGIAKFCIKKKSKKNFIRLKLHLREEQQVKFEKIVKVVETAIKGIPVSKDAVLRKLAA